MSNRKQRIGVWGSAEGAEDFCARLSAMSRFEVEYVSSWTELLPVSAARQGMQRRLYAFPSAEEYVGLPAFFEALSAFARYEVYVAWPSGYACPLPYNRREEIEGVVFFRFSFARMNLVQRGIKRVFDMLCGGLGLLVLLPFLVLCAVLVKLSSRGPVFYSQERIGRGGRPFRIYKFRSMRTDAEVGVPRLSSLGDPRITAWGNIMRRYRLDEIPQLWNALKGDMSVVGYRPERAYFIDRIVEKAPYYPLLYSVKPGITSLGITTFGYAENVPQMIVRLSCDMAYMERLSLKEDVRILGRTCRVIVYGVGK
ncbi:MAG: sugar transferase [Bacteroidales bacterium]|nr:sugar transferase [Bacteroidales bacterium]